MQRFFEGKPKSKLSIDTMIEDLELRKPPNVDQIITLLRDTKKFLSITDPLFQKDRASFKDPTIKKILEDAGSRLASFQQVVTTDGDGKEAFKFCCEAHEERLDTLKTNNDKIYLYYSQHDNPLRTILESQSLKNTYTS